MGRRRPRAITAKDEINLRNPRVAAPDIFDAIIIGGGPAGLTAAAYLGRFRRRCLVLETGDSRARWIPTAEGAIAATDIHNKLRGLLGH